MEWGGVTCPRWKRRNPARPLDDNCQAEQKDAAKLANNMFDFFPI